MEVIGSGARSQGSRVTLNRGGGIRYERQAKFIEWLTDLFTRAGNQGILLESLTDVELEWIGRM
jgi:hypothetical protein